ncbi:MAG: MBL fold metallo-hydrolase [Gemmatimonadaceae bacterium]
MSLPVLRLARAAVLALPTIALAPAAAQTRTAFPAERGVRLNAFPRLIQLARNVFGYEEIRAPGFTTVSLIVVGANGVLVADGQGSPQATRTMLERIRTVTDKPVRWYVVGSDHGDHTAGNSELPDGVEFVVHATSRAQLQRDSIAAAEANGKASADAAARQQVAPAPRVVVVPPVSMTSDRQRIDLGGMEVEVRFLGRAHTGGDLSVYLPREKILFMSEAYLNRVFPAMRSAYPSEWVRTLNAALAMEVSRYVPGHGFIEAAAASREELVVYRDALEHVIAEASRLHALGLSPEAAIAQANWGPYKDWFLADQQAAIAVRRVYDELEGRLPR